MATVLDQTNDPAPTGDDLVYLIGNPGGVPVDRKATLDSLAASAPFSGLYGNPGDWTDLGNLGASETISGADQSFVRAKGVLNQSCAITIAVLDNEQIDLLLEQGGAGAFATTFIGVDTWTTSTGTAPVTSTRQTGDLDRFYFETVDGVTIGYWITESPEAIPVTDVTGTSDTISAAECGGVRRYTDNALVTVTLPHGLGVGSIVELLFWGTAGGAVQDNGTSVVHTEGTIPQYKAVSCLVVAADTWSVVGTVTP